MFQLVEPQVNDIDVQIGKTMSNIKRSPRQNPQGPASDSSRVEGSGGWLGAAK